MKERVKHQTINLQKFLESFEILFWKRSNNSEFLLEPKCLLFLNIFKLLNAKNLRGMSYIWNTVENNIKHKTVKISNDERKLTPKNHLAAQESLATFWLCGSTSSRRLINAVWWRHFISIVAISPFICLYVKPACMTPVKQNIDSYNSAVMNNQMI